MHPTPIQIRPFRVGDSPALRALFDRWSDRSTYQRFFSVSPRMATGYVDELADRERTLFAVIAIDDEGDVVGVGSTHRASPDRAEFGLAVDESSQGHGVGTQLLAALLRNARQHQLTSLVAYVEPANHQMLEVILDELPDATRELRDGVVTVTVPVEAAIHRRATHRAQGTPS